VPSFAEKYPKIKYRYVIFDGTPNLAIHVYTEWIASKILTGQKNSRKNKLLSVLDSDLRYTYRDPNVRDRYLLNTLHN
jgi:hypothetical protein